MQPRAAGADLDVVGTGSPALLLPALSSISTREEMRPLAERLAGRFRCLIPDWPGFGNRARGVSASTPDALRGFLDGLIDRAGREPLLGIAAGHAAPYLVEAACRWPGRFTHVTLVAPTWRGPLPTAMGEARRPLFARLRRLVELPVLGPLLYGLNVSPPIVRMMLREHVYADPDRVDAALVKAKLAVTRQRRARFATAAFVAGELDPVRSRVGFLELFAGPLPPTLVLRPLSGPPRSTAEIDALVATGRVAAVDVPGALAAHEEHPDAVAAAIIDFVERS